MESIGIFKLAKTNEYEFTPYDFLTNKEENKAGKKQQTGSNTNFGNKQKANKGALMVLAVLIIMAVLGVVAWGTYNLFLKGNTNTSGTDIVNTNAVINMADTNRNSQPAKDTVAIINSDTADYKFIYETTSSAFRAYTRTGQLKSYGNPAELDSTITDTAKMYNLYIKMRLYYADTARVKDSMQKQLQRTITILPFK